MRGFSVARLKGAAQPRLLALLPSAGAAAPALHTARRYNAPAPHAGAGSSRASTTAVASSAAGTGTSTAAVTAAAAGAPPSWQIRMLYDSDCPLCLKEVDMLRRRDAGKGAIDFVDIASPTYSAADNAGISYDQAMGRIHAILPDGQIISGVEVFRRLYEAVGLGWVYAITKVEPVGRLAEAVYGVWAKYRMEVTGREPLAVILDKRRKSEEEMTCRGSGADAAACEAPPPPAAGKQ